jgi:two-component system chemotaxis response regulator CheB
MPITPSGPWIIAVGASGADGLTDIKSLLAALGLGLDGVLMVVLHRPFERPSRLREVLQGVTSMPVIIARQGEEMRAGCCYIGEPAAHLTMLANAYAGITDDTGNLSRNRTVDLLFKSIAAHAGRKAIGIVLSGALDDGSRGTEAISEAGGKTMVVLRSVTHAGMPENAETYDGPIDFAGSTADIAAAVRSLISPRREGAPSGATPVKGI